MGKTYNPLDLREVFKMKKGVLAVERELLKARIKQAQIHLQIKW